jgi:predicted Zn-dependent peptidase
MRVLDDGMSTRLHRRLTDESGLAYEAFAALDPYEETGLVEVGASVEHDKVPELLRTVLSMMTDLREAAVSDAELEKARTRYRWTLRRLVDSAEDMALYAGTQAVFGRAVDLGELWREVERITAAQMQTAARRVVRHENLYAMCVGKLKRAVQKEAEQVIADWS